MYNFVFVLWKVGLLHYELEIAWVYYCRLNAVAEFYKFLIGFWISNVLFLLRYPIFVLNEPIIVAVPV